MEEENDMHEADLSGHFAQGEVETAELDQYADPTERAFKLSEHREHTRSKIALYYVIGFLFIVLLSIAVAMFLLYQNKIEFENLTGVLVTISGILSGPLGFIIGYYFKAEQP